MHSSEDTVSAEAGRAHGTPVSGRLGSRRRMAPSGLRAVVWLWTTLQVVGHASAALAAGADGAPAEIEEIIVIGTAIRSTPIDAHHSVTVADRDALERQGWPLTVDLFKQLGASNGVVGERQSWYNSSLPNTILESVSNVNLRGLGASRTLVLFNGQRQTYLPARLIGGRLSISAPCRPWRSTGSRCSRREQARSKAPTRWGGSSIW